MLGNVLYWVVIFIHIVVSLALIMVILLQAGRGGGLSESFGSSSTQTILGTKTSVFLKRATAACAIIYFFTCLILAVMTSHRGMSVVSRGISLPAKGMPSGAKVPQQPLPDMPEDF